MKSGFTLIELLAVMGVIGILATLGFSLLRFVRETSLDIKCKNNLRELSEAAILYSDEHRGLFPWAMRTMSDCWDFKTIRGEYVMGEMWEYTSSKDILACPKCRGRGDNWAGGKYTGYNYNSCYAGKVKGDSGKRKGPSRIQDFPNPSGMVLFGDAGYGDPEQMNKFMRAPKFQRNRNSGLLCLQGRERHDDRGLCFYPSSLFCLFDIIHDFQMGVSCVVVFILSGI